MAFICVNGADFSKPSLPVSAKSEGASLSRPTSSRTTSSATSSVSWQQPCIRQGASCSPPLNAKPSVKQCSKDDCTVRRWYGAGGKWLYTELVLPDGNKVVVEGEKPGDVTEVVMCRQRVERFGGKGKARAVGCEGSDGSLKFDEEDRSRPGSAHSSAKSTAPLGYDMMRIDSGLSATRKSSKFDSREPSPKQTKASRSKSDELLLQGTTYGTFDADLEFGANPARQSRRTWNCNFSYICSKIPWFETVLVIVWVAFLVLFIQTLYLRKDKYGCYWGCDRGLKNNGE